MIDNLISDPTRQIWSCILKVMNFIIFRDFFGIFLSFKGFIFIEKHKKWFLICADVAIDVVGA